MHYGNMGFSPEQEFFYDQILRLGCMAYAQGEKLLMDYFKCTPNQAERVIHSLKKIGVLTYDRSMEYILAGSKLVHKTEPLSRSIIETLYVALDCIEDNADGIDAVRKLKKTAENDGVIFVSNDTIYKVQALSEQKLSDIYLDEEQHKNDPTDTVHIFVFSAGAHKDYILEELKKHTFTMSYALVFMKSSDITQNHGYDIITP